MTDSAIAVLLAVAKKWLATSEPQWGLLQLSVNMSSILIRGTSQGSADADGTRKFLPKMTVGEVKAAHRQEGPGAPGESIPLNWLCIQVTKC